MTKKDYILIASALSETRKIWSPDPGQTDIFVRERVILTTAALTMARKLQAANPRFDVDRFLDACGVPVEERNQ